jgi:hypothetical protein
VRCPHGARYCHVNMASMKAVPSIGLRSANIRRLTATCRTELVTTYGTLAVATTTIRNDLSAKHPLMR